MHTWCSTSFMFICSKACATSCWNPSPVWVEKLSTVPFSHMSWATWWAACCFKKSKLLPYLRVTSYKRSNVMAPQNETGFWNWQHNISHRPTVLFEAVLIEIPSCIWGQLLFKNEDRRGCNGLEPSFLEGNPWCKVGCTMSMNLMTNWHAKKITAYLKNVVKCLPICKMSGGDIVKMLQIAPPRKHCHSEYNFPFIRYVFYTEEWNYLCVTFPLLSFSSRTLSINTHKCFPHFPKSSECRVSYEYARYGLENRKSQRKCYSM